MDVACFAPYQRICNSLCHKIKRETSGTITQHNACGLACKAYIWALIAENPQADFRMTGILPLNKDVIANEFLIPSEAFIPGKSVETCGE